MQGRRVQDHIAEGRPPGEPRPRSGRRVGGAGTVPALTLLASILVLAGLAACTGEAPPGATAEAPDWLPRYPGSESQSIFEAPTEEGFKGTVALTTADGASEVVSFYKEELEGAGFEVEITPYPTNHGRGASLQGHSASETEGLFLIVSPRGDGGSSVYINYEQARRGE